MPKLDDILSTLPVIVNELPNDEEPLVLYMQRTPNTNGASWFCFYSAEDDGVMVNGTLTGAGQTLVDALGDLLHNYQTDFKQWQKDNKI